VGYRVGLRSRQALMRDVGRGMWIFLQKPLSGLRRANCYAELTRRHKARN